MDADVVKLCPYCIGFGIRPALGGIALACSWIGLPTSFQACCATPFLRDCEPKQVATAKKNRPLNQETVQDSTEAGE